MKQSRFFAILMALCLVVTMVPVLPVRAEQVTSGTLDGRTTTMTWEFEDGTLTITGDDYCIDDKTAPWEHLRYEIESIVFDGSLTIIPEIFSNFPCLKNIVWPKDVTYLNGAFNNCYNLESVVVPDTVYDLEFSFDYCISLNYAVLPAGLDCIQSSFDNCGTLCAVIFLGDAPTYIYKTPF